MKISNLENNLVPFDLLSLADEDEKQIDKYRNSAKFLASYSEEGLTGMLGMKDIGSGEREIVCVAVYKRYENRGFATRLIEAAIRDSREKGFRELVIKTGNCGLKQLYLYQKCGFRFTGVRPDFFTRKYDHPIYENGLLCRDQIELRCRIYSHEEQEEAVKEYWQRFITTCPKHAESAYEAWSFGHGPALADKLIALVKEGKKMATSSAIETFPEDEKIPEPGELSILLQGNGLPGCIIRTVELREKAFRDITEDEAALEGEGDQSLSHWKEDHEEYFRYEYELSGKPFHDGIPVLFEKFELIYDEDRKKGVL